MSAPVERIVVVDDDVQTCSMLRYLLQDEGFAVEAFNDTTRVAERIRNDDVSLLVLDVSIGPVDGFTLMDSLRQVNCCPPVVFLSGHEEREVRLRAFKMGALDYMTKPIDVVELVARVRVALRRVQRARNDARRQAARSGLTLDARTCRATRSDGTGVRLTPHEARLLKVLMDHHGAIVTRDELLNRVWGVDYDGASNVIDVYIRRLRRKIEGGPEDTRFIHTIRGVGYAFDPTTPAAVPTGLAPCLV